jgi:DNA-binding NarL/FixJ family response regulator
VKPFRPLTTRQEDVAKLLGRGWTYKRIAATLRMSPRTVAVHVEEIALLLANPDDLAAGTLVMLWAAHRAWEQRRAA